MGTPYWLEQAPILSEPLAGERSVDVVVIGAGITGTAAARLLVKSGITVGLVEARKVAYSATGRNAGFILQGTAERYNRAVELMGRERAMAIHQYSLENHDAIKRCIKEDGIECGYKRRGSLQLAGTKEEEAELIESLELLNEDGFKAELRRDLPEHYREAGFNFGVFLPQDGELHPAQYVRGCVRKLQEQGLLLFEETSVQQLIDTPDGVTLICSNGSIKAQLAIVCTNAYLPQLLPVFKGKIDPVRGQMLATAPAPRLFEVPIYADHGYDYWRQDDQGRIVLGGWRNLDPEGEVGYEELLHEDIQNNMRQFLNRFKALQGIELTHSWSGIMGFSYDGLPLLGMVPNTSSTLVAAGFTGHGFGFGQLAGEAVAEVALEGSHPFASLLSCRRIIQ